MAEYELGVIGGGNMAEAIIGGLAASGFVDARRIIVSDVSAERRAVLSREHNVVCTDDNLASAAVPKVLLAVKPQVMPTVLAQIAAEELGVSLEEVSVTSGDTASTPFDQGTFSSRVTLYTGTAVRSAAQDAKKRLKEIASRMLEIAEDDLDVANRCVFALGTPEKRVTFEDIMRHCHNYEGVIIGRGWGGGKGDWPGLAHRKGSKEAAPGWKYGAQAVEVEVDPETGVIRVLKLVSVHDVGQALNPLAVEGQIEGGAIMGLSFGLFEELAYDQGKVCNPTFMDYRIPTALEIPRIIPVVVENPLPQGPFGAKGIGELSLLGVAPAIANAIYNAVGVRMRDLPLKPEKVLAALEEKNG